MNKLKPTTLRLLTNKTSEARYPCNSSGICMEEEVLSQIIHAYNNRLASRRLNPSTISNKIRVLNHFIEYTSLYPWQWTSEDFEDWSAYLYTIRNNSEATQRGKQRIINQFQSFLLESPKLIDLIETSFSVKPKHICSELNLIAHKVEDENKEKRIAFTKNQLESLWKFFDEEIVRAYQDKDKNFKTLQRDKVLYFIIYYFGLRANEAAMLNVTDFVKNPKKPEWGNLGGVIVRHGKASAGSPPKRRLVWTISDEAVEYLKWYFESVRPQFCFDDNESLFLSERGSRLSPKSITRNFKNYIFMAGLPTENYSTHCLRHSYISHLSENCSISPRFIQEQVGHAYLATTQLYTHLSDSFVEKQLNNAINRQLSKFVKGWIKNDI